VCYNTKTCVCVQVPLGLGRPNLQRAQAGGLSAAGRARRHCAVPPQRHTQGLRVLQAVHSAHRGTDGACRRQLQPAAPFQAVGGRRLEALACCVSRAQSLGDAIDAGLPRKNAPCFERTKLPPEEQLSNVPGTHGTRNRCATLAGNSLPHGAPVHGNGPPKPACKWEGKPIVGS
jgi:hypothetical protein